MSPAESPWEHEYALYADTQRHAHSTSVLLLLCSPVDRPGVLVLEVLEVQEECSMQLAHCEHHQPPREGHQHSNSVPEERARVLVVFNRETAAQLIPAPRDIIHIYPPWWENAIHVARKRPPPLRNLFTYCYLTWMFDPRCAKWWDKSLTREVSEFSHSSTERGSSSEVTLNLSFNTWTYEHDFVTL